MAVIHCISDLNGEIPDLPGGDLLIVCGNLSDFGSGPETRMFASWLDNLSSYKQKVVIAGCNDHYLADGRNPFKKSHYLIGSSIEMFGYKIWGAPYVPNKKNLLHVTKRCCTQQMYNEIPKDTDIVITHCPPYGILDKNIYGEHCGCEELKLAIDKIKPKYSVFGHIDESYGRTEENGTVYINCSYMSSGYVVARRNCQSLQLKPYTLMPNCT